MFDEALIGHVAVAQIRNGSRRTVRRLSVGRRGRIESDHQRAESTLSVMHRSDFQGEDDGTDEHVKHTRSDRPCLRVVNNGPSRSKLNVS